MKQFNQNESTKVTTINYLFENQNTDSIIWLEILEKDFDSLVLTKNRTLLNQIKIENLLVRNSNNISKNTFWNLDLS